MKPFKSVFFLVYTFFILTILSFSQRETFKNNNASKYLVEVGDGETEKVTKPSSWHYSQSEAANEAEDNVKKAIENLIKIKEKEEKKYIGSSNEATDCKERDGASGKEYPCTATSYVNFE
ncbi:MAG: hypothetical protein NW226_25385 [Microscillaceae bacterium]|nr:hypothetical protein [Microscillaceae bacterium]